MVRITYVSQLQEVKNFCWCSWAKSDSVVTLEGESGYIRYAYESLETWRSVELLLLIWIDSLLLPLCCFPYPLLPLFHFSYYFPPPLCSFVVEGLVWFSTLKWELTKISRRGRHGSSGMWQFTTCWSAVKFKEWLQKRVLLIGCLRPTSCFFSLDDLINSRAACFLKNYNKKVVRSVLKFWAVQRHEIFFC